MSLIASIFLVSSSNTPGNYSLAGIIILTALSQIIFFSLHIRRFHDFGKSGWMSLLVLIPIVNFITLIALAAIPSEEVDNRYGVYQSQKGFLDDLLGRNS
jgi:uncharacterized membrane protein YhaH (DUF805 family)